jgi:hypothetical protein
MRRHGNRLLAQTAQARKLALRHITFRQRGIEPSSPRKISFDLGVLVTLPETALCSMRVGRPARKAALKKPPSKVRNEPKKAKPAPGPMYASSGVKG